MKSITVEIPMSEADLKRTVEDYLQIGQNQGKWIFLRLNAGDFIEVRGNTRRRIKGCQRFSSLLSSLMPLIWWIISLGNK